MVGGLDEVVVVVGRGWFGRLVSVVGLAEGGGWGLRGGDGVRGGWGWDVGCGAKER